MNRKVLSLMAILTFSLSACGSPQGDLDEFCTIVGDVMGNDEKKKKDIAIGKAVSMNMKTDEVKELMKSLIDTPAKKRYKKLLKGAKKLGVEGYKCKAAKKYFKWQRKNDKKK